MISLITSSTTDPRVKISNMRNAVAQELLTLQ